MGQITVLEDRLYVESRRMAEEQRFRWGCFCKEPEPWSSRKSSRDIWSTLEALRQHWATVHPAACETELIDWFSVHKQVPWLTGDHLRGADGRWTEVIIEHLANDKITYSFPTQGKNHWNPWRTEEDLSPPYIFTTPTVTGAAYFRSTSIMEEEKKGMARLTDIRSRMRELEREAARYARFPEKDEWPVDTVITYKWSPPVNDEAKVYSYAVLKAGNGQWYWTGEFMAVGRQRSISGDYDALIEHLADDGVSDIRIATPEVFMPLFVEEVIGEEAAAQVNAFLANPEIGVRVERPEKNG